MLENKKYSYPCVGELPKKPDMDLIKGFLDQPGLVWEDPFVSQPGISMVNGEVAETTLKTIEHLCLTGPSKHDNAKTGQAYRLEEMSGEERRELSNKEWKNISVKDKLKGRAGHLMNEYNWGDPYDFYKDSELHKYITEFFAPDPIIRIRFSRMKPGAHIPPHVDYNTTYAVRFIIPISGNEGVINRFWYRGEEKDFFLENGKAYFLNIGFKHAVYHNGDKERLYLIGTLGGQSSIEPIKIDKYIQ